MPLGSEIQGDDGSSKGNRPKQHRASKEPQRVESVMREIMSRVATVSWKIVLADRHSAKSPSGKGDPSSSSSSSSSLPSGGGGSPGGSNPEATGAVQSPIHHPVGRVRKHTRR